MMIQFLLAIGDDENALKQIDTINKLNESDRFKNKKILPIAPGDIKVKI